MNYGLQMGRMPEQDEDTVKPVLTIEEARKMSKILTASRCGVKGKLADELKIHVKQIESFYLSLRDEGKMCFSDCALEAEARFIEFYVNGVNNGKGK